jgi:rhodanese-related sulfurtransferase
MPTPIDRDQVQRLLGEDAQLVEVLPQAEYVDEHLPGAVNLPLKELGRESVPALALDRARSVIVYCYDSQ